MKESIRPQLNKSQCKQENFSRIIKQRSVGTQTDIVLECRSSALLTKSAVAVTAESSQSTVTLHEKQNTGKSRTVTSQHHSTTPHVPATTSLGVRIHTAKPPLQPRITLPKTREEAELGFKANKPTTGPCQKYNISKSRETCLLNPPKIVHVPWLMQPSEKPPDKNTNNTKHSFKPNTEFVKSINPTKFTEQKVLGKLINQPSEPTKTCVLSDPLLNGEWLTDEHINAYLSLLDSTVGKEHNVYFMTPVISQAVKCLQNSNAIELPLEFFNMSYIFVPVNDALALDFNSKTHASGSHWSLLLFSKRENKFYYFDSTNLYNLNSAKKTVQKLSRYLSNFGELKMETVKTPQQTNSRDCGIYLILIIDAILKNITSNPTGKLNFNLPDFSEEDILSKRFQISSIVNNPQATMAKCVPEVRSHSNTIQRSTYSSITSTQNIPSENKKDPQNQSQILTHIETTQIVNKIEKQNKDHFIKTSRLQDITDQRLPKPRKNRNLLLSDIYDLLFEQNNTKPQHVPVLTVNVTLDDNPDKILPCIIDTGCNINIIRADIIPNKKFNTQKTTKLISANNVPLKVLGSTEVTFKIDNVTLKDTFYVTPDVTSPILLGNTFLFKNNVELSFTKQQIIITQNQKDFRIPMDKTWHAQIARINTVKQNQSKPATTDVKSNQEIIIAPHQFIKIKDLENVSKEAYFETDRNLRLHKKCHAFLTENSETGQHSVNIYNASNFPKRISTNTTIGYIQYPSEHESNKNTFNITTTKLSNTQKEIVTDRHGETLDISPHLTVEEHQQVVKLLNKYRHMFTSKTTDLKPAKLPPVKLELKPDAKPVNCPPFKQGKFEREKLNQLLDELVEADVLEPCPDFTQYASPVFLTKNRDNSYRIITDFRKVNSQLKTDVYPLNSVNLVLSALNKANTFTKLDLKGAFHQLEVHEDFRHILTIKSQDRLLRYKRLPMGLSVSPALFNKNLIAILNKHLYNKAINYIDDVICYSNSDFKTDLQNVEIILKELEKTGLLLNTKKCKFLYDTCDILGHTISKSGILPQKESVRAIQEFKTPTTVRQVRQFLGCSGFFRRFIKNYANIAYPLTELIKEGNKNNTFKWTDACENSFMKIKEILTKPPLLSHWRDDRESIIYVDSSLYGLGAALVQKDTCSDRLYPVSYISKKYTPAQSRYTNAEREFLSLTYAVNYFREFTLGRQTTVFTDCAALQYYKNFKHTSTRLNRLALSLVDYDLIVKYKKGSTNLLADGLSRNPLPNEIDEDIIDPCFSINLIQEINLPLLQAQDEYLKKIKLAMQNPELVDGKFRRAARQYILVDDILYYKHFNGRESTLLLAIPKSQKEGILKIFHDSHHSGGHLSHFKTLSKIKTKYYWPSLNKDVLEYTKTCPSCQIRRPKTFKNYGKLMPQPAQQKPMTRLILDFLGPLNSSFGYKYILVATDSCTRYAFTTPCRNADADTVAQKLLDLSYTYGFPLIITHDRGSHFMNNVLKQLSHALGINQRPAAAYIPQIQGSCEKFNSVLIKSISHYIETKPHTWSKYINACTFAYNISKNISTNLSPFYLMFGYEANTPSDLMYLPPDPDKTVLEHIKVLEEVRKDVPNIIKKAQDSQKKYYDKDKQNLNLKPGDEVLIYFPKDHTKKFNKFLPKFRGPFTVTGKVNDLTYNVNIIKHGKLVEDQIHVSRIKLFYKRV